MEWGMGMGPLPIHIFGSEERRELIRGARGGAPAGNVFWRILKATARAFLYLYADALS